MEWFGFVFCGSGGDEFGVVVSFTVGRLPFDKVSEKVYGVGFRYDLRGIKDRIL